MAEKLLYLKGFQFNLIVSISAHFTFEDLSGGKNVIKFQNILSDYMSQQEM